MIPSECNNFVESEFLIEKMKCISIICTLHSRLFTQMIEHCLRKSIAEKVFDPYFTAKSEGSGMGLAISEKIIRQHGGQIHFETGPEGTVFRLSLPMEIPHD